MNPGDAIFIAGHRGMVGSALVRLLRQRGFTNLLLRTRKELDLCDNNAVRAFYAKEKPAYVFVAAARVGGIGANAALPVEFLSENLRIELNVIDGAYEAGVTKLLFLGSSCIYPKLAPQPIHEDALLTGSLEPTNEPYALAKICGVRLCQAYAKQHGARVHLGHADKSLRSRGQLRSRDLPRPPRVDRQISSRESRRGKKRLRFGAPAIPIENSSTSTTWPRRASS